MVKKLGRVLGNPSMVLYYLPGILGVVAYCIFNYFSYEAVSGVIVPLALSVGAASVLRKLYKVSMFKTAPLLSRNGYYLLQTLVVSAILISGKLFLAFK